MERDKTAEVRVHVVAVANFLKCSNDREANTVQENGRADGGTSGKQIAAHLIPENDDSAVLRIIEFVDPAAFMDGQIPDLVEISGHAVDLAAGLVEIADGPNIVARNHGRGRAHARALAEDVFVIVVGQIILAQRGEAALHDRGAPRPYKHNVLAQGVELPAISGAEAFAKSHQQQ